jgi:hypothetical protein
MKQIVIKKGNPVVVDVPPPSAVPGFILVEIRASCVSPGTEMAGIEASGKTLLQRILAQPDKAKAALGQMRSQGFSAVWNKAMQNMEKEGGWVQESRVSMSGCGWPSPVRDMPITPRSWRFP